MKKIKQINLLLILIISVTALSLSACNSQPPQNKQISIIFRFDDYSAISDTEIEGFIIEAFRSINKPFTVGVIPFRETENPDELLSLSGEKADLLKEAVDSGVVDPALHGYSHKQIIDGTHSEFVSLPLDQQVEKISIAKTHLENTLDQSITTFIPPWSSYDNNTVTALEQLGFSTLSAGKAGVAPERSTLLYLPATTGLSDLKNGISLARESSYDQIIAVVLFHQYDFIENNADRGVTTRSDFVQLLNWVSSQEDVEILSVSQAVSLFPELDVERFITSQQSSSPKFVFVESTLGEESLNDFLYRDGVIPSVSWFKAAGFYAALLLVGAAAVFVFTAIVLKLRKRAKLVLLVLSLMTSVALSVYSLSDGIVYKSGGLMMVFVYSVSLGLLLSLLRKRDTNTPGIS